MIRALVFSVLSTVLALSSPAAQAASIVYTISGAGSGYLDDGTTFTDAAFTFTLTGDSSHFHDFGFGPVVDPLTDAKVAIAGLGPLDFLTPTRIGENGGAIYFANSQLLNPYANQADLFDFHLSNPINLYGKFGPVAGTGVFALNQFEIVPTSGGYLTFTGSTDVLFSSTGTPEPASWALMVVGFGVVGAGLRRRSPAPA